MWNRTLRSRLAGSLFATALFACGAPAPQLGATANPTLPSRTTAPSPPVDAAAPVPEAAPRPVPLGNRSAARVKAAYGAVDAAVADWHLGAFGETCLILFDESQEWLVGCPGMSGTSGFTPTGESSDNGPIFWNAPSLRLSEQSMPYDTIKLALVATVGTYKNDSAPDELPVLLVQDWDALHRNHPAFADSLIEDWLGVFVHEAFHTRQLWQPRVARDAKEGLQPDALAAFYDANAPFRAAVEKERELLAHAVDEPNLNAKSARRALSKWLTQYDRRGATFHSAMDAATPGHDAWRMDGAETFIEGTARYVEARFLMAPHEDLDAALASDPSYGRFASSRGKRASQLAGLSGGGSKYFYAIGMYVSFLMDAADPGWKKNVFDSDGLLVDAVRRTVRGSG